MTNQKLHKKEEQRGITLIALIITVIVLLILAGISINAIVGDNGVTVKAKWSGFVHEYEAVNEKKEIYAVGKDAERYVEEFKSRKDLDESKLKEIYPVIGNEIGITDSIIANTLKTTIYEIDGLEPENCKLYELDLGKIDAQAKRRYIVNIKTGTIYTIQGENYQNKVWHIPRWGVKRNQEETPPTPTFDLIYDANGGDETSVPTREKVAVENGIATTNISEIEPTREGYIFYGWKKESDISNTLYRKTVESLNLDNYPDNYENELTHTITMIDDTKLVAVWAKEYKLKYNGNKIGTEKVSNMPNPTEEIKISPDESATFKISGTEPTMTGGYLFGGWSLNEAGTGTIYKNNTTNNQITINKTIANETNTTITQEIYAKWEQDKELVLSQTSLNISVGQKMNLTAKYGETNVTKSATWTSSDGTIATVNKGKVTGVSANSNKINMTVEYDGKTATCEVKVIDLIEEIYTIEDLQLFSNQVSYGNKFTGKTVKLMNNLDFKNASSYESTTSTEYNKYYKSKTTWTPIGVSKSIYFEGVFEGNEHEIKNLYINATTANQGLFGYSIGGTFKNFILSNVDISSTSYNVGSVLGIGGNIILSNIQTTGKINVTGSDSESHADVGGIVGHIGSYGAIITNCTNGATVESIYHCVSGIVGHILKGEISSCINNNSITGDRNVSGIASWAGDNSVTGCVVTINNCKNYGVITGSTVNAYNVGGISAYIDNGSKITNCQNRANISCVGKQSGGIARVGGIVGYISSVGNNIVDNCINYNEVYSYYPHCGGIVGTHMNGTVSNCVNEGYIHSKTYGLGGIAGQLGETTSHSGFGTISKCKNKGKVEITESGVGARNAGGIVGGSVDGVIELSVNEGEVITYGYASSSDKTSRTGGIVGVITTGSSNAVRYCYNTGNVTGSYSGIGGICGNMSVSANITYCYSKGTIKGPTSIGGILGYKKAGTVGSECCYLTGSVIPSSGSANSYGTSQNETTIKGLSSQTGWKTYFKTDKTPNINGGYPILKWQ